MRASTVVLTLPALACAQQQVPLMDQVKGWFAKASDTITSALPSSVEAPSIPNPVASGAKAVAALKVQPIDIDNYKEVLKPKISSGLEEWMVYATGGNNTCRGTCGHADKAWNESIPLISASTNPPELGTVDCEANPVLCLAWSVRPPAIMHFFLPQPLPDQSTPDTTYRYFFLNRTTVTAGEIARLHLEEKYQDKEPYEGTFHPFNSFLAKNNLALPAGYAIHYFNKIPSWLFMVGISMFSRTIMSRRQQPGVARGPGA